MSPSPSQIHYTSTVKNVSQNQNVTLTFMKKLCTWQPTRARTNQEQDLTLKMTLNPEQLKAMVLLTGSFFDVHQLWLLLCTQENLKGYWYPRSPRS